MINKPKEKPKEEPEENKPLSLSEFIDKYETKIKGFGMLQDYDARWGTVKFLPFSKSHLIAASDLVNCYSRDYLRDNPPLVCTETASYLTMWCINLAVEDVCTLSSWL